jgi:hypothetical protein
MRQFGRRVGPPPSERFEPVASAARRTCRGSSWSSVTSTLIEAHRHDARATHERDLSKHAASIAGRRAEVNCWPEASWTPLVDHFQLIVRDEFWLAGLASPASGRIDLAPTVCEPLRMFFRGNYSPILNLQSFELAEAIVVLAHEAEHLRTPAESEAVVECHALQRVRSLVRRAGRRSGYQNEMAGLAWDVGYPQQLADYRTRLCRDGGGLDLHPRSTIWP